MDIIITWPLLLVDCFLSFSFCWMLLLALLLVWYGGGGGGIGWTGEDDLLLLFVLLPAQDLVIPNCYWLCEMGNSSPTYHPGPVTHWTPIDYNPGSWIVSLVWDHYCDTRPILLFSQLKENFYSSLQIGSGLLGGLLSTQLLLFPNPSGMQLHGPSPDPLLVTSSCWWLLFLLLLLTLYCGVYSIAHSVIGDWQTPIDYWPNSPIVLTLGYWTTGPDNHFVEPSGIPHCYLIVARRCEPHLTYPLLIGCWYSSSGGIWLCNYYWLISWF